MTTFQKYIVLFVVFGLLMTSLCKSLARCPAGQYLSPTDKCEKCKNGSFMDEDNHSNSQCKSCQEQGEDTVLVGVCNTTHDTVLECKEGRYNTNGHSIVCQPCTNCTAINKYEAVKCYSTSDRICCPEPAMSVEKKNGINQCSQTATDTSYCCVEKTTPANKIPVSEPFSYERTTEFNTRNLSQKSGDFYANDSKSLKDDVKSSSRLDDVTIGGIVAGVVVVLIIVIVIIYLSIRYKTKQSKESGPETEELNTKEKNLNKE